MKPDDTGRWQGPGDRCPRSWESSLSPLASISKPVPFSRILSSPRSLLAARARVGSSEPPSVTSCAYPRGNVEDPRVGAWPWVSVCPHGRSHALVLRTAGHRCDSDAWRGLGHPALHCDSHRMKRRPHAWPEMCLCGFRNLGSYCHGAAAVPACAALTLAARARPQALPLGVQGSLEHC